MPITPLPLPAGPAALEALPSLEQALTGTAPIHPHAPGEHPSLPEGELPDDLAVAIATSGSTGTPKGVMLTHRNLAANVAQIRPVQGMVADDRILAVLPFFHIYGMTVLLNAALHKN